MNGTWKFLNEIKRPWKANVRTEKYTQGQWLMQALNRTYDDFCDSLHLATEPWAYAFEGKESCPISAGVNFH